MQSLSDILTQQTVPDEEMQAAINRNVTSRNFPKGSMIQRQGETASYAYFVKKGLLRSFTIDEKGKEHIFMFAPEGWMISDIESHAYDSPAELFIEALEDSEVEVINRALIKELKLSHEALLEETGRLLRRVGVLQRRVIMLMSSPAIDRYEHFVQTYPQMIHRVPQRMIASYLGITPETLSALRSRKAKQG